MSPDFTWARQTLLKVREFAPPEDSHCVGMYLGVGRTLDWHYGIDAFFMLGYGLGTIDVTTRPDDAKVVRSSVDFCFYKDDLYNNWEIKCFEIARKLFVPHDGMKRAFRIYNEDHPNSPLTPNHPG